MNELKGTHAGALLLYRHPAPQPFWPPADERAGRRPPQMHKPAQSKVEGGKMKDEDWL
jgi:hypothetical protein